MSSSVVRWEKPPLHVLPDRNSVHVWKGDVMRDPGSIVHLEPLLDELEQEKARGLRDSLHARCYITSHAMLRLVLARYLDVDPAALRFVKGRAGKPALHPDYNSSLEFNLSHSGDCIVLAVASGFPVGIDIESTARKTDIEGIAARFFTASESGKIARQPDKMRIGSFFRCWTRKEAYAKAKGLGVAIGLDSFEVPVLPEEPLTLLACDRFPSDAGLWRFVDIPAGDGYVCSLAIPESPDGVQYYRFDPADFPGCETGRPGPA